MLARIIAPKASEQLMAELMEILSAGWAALIRKER